MGNITNESMIKRDKRIHELHRLHMWWDSDKKQYYGTHKNNKHRIIKYQDLITFDDEDWNKIIENIKKELNESKI